MSGMVPAPQTCPLCGGESRFFSAARDYLHGTPGAFVLLRCTQCEVTFTSPQLTTEEVGAYYRADGREGDAPPPELTRRRMRLLRSIAEPKDALIRRYVPEGRLLDIGCNDGSFLLGMKLLGWRGLDGVERNFGAVSRARARGLEVVQALFPEEVGRIRGRYDVVVMSHVLEHLVAPRSALQAAAVLLERNGILLVTLPNPRCLEARIFGARWIGYDVPRHYYTFPPECFRRLAKEEGFDVVAEACTDDPHGAVLLSITLALSGTRFRSIWRSISRFLMIGVVSSCLAPIYGVLAAFGNRPSITYTLRRSESPGTWERPPP
jgi:2-polyprenyl-3-methyl-5-hydroxy-6-metoxy-1,4-benzoquinol methylase